MTDQKNMILAIVLSAIVLIVWQYFVGMPQLEKQKQQVQQQQQAQQTTQQPGTAPTTQVAPSVPSGSPVAPPNTQPVTAQPITRDAALAASPRVRIETQSLAGSIALKGGRKVLNARRAKGRKKLSA